MCVHDAPQAKSKISCEPLDARPPAASTKMPGEGFVQESQFPLGSASVRDT